MKKLIYTCACLMSLNTIWAQTETSPCGTDESHKAYLSQHPEAKQQEDAYNNAFMQYMQSLDLSKFKVQGREKTSAPVYLIPVVFHILHNNGSENISDQRVRDEITILNENFRANSRFRDRIRPIFEDIEADAQIEFRLAKFDPKGTPTNGIERIYIGSLANKANDNVKFNSWDNNRYLNIWVAGSIQINSAFPVGGYAYFPNSYPSARVDGPIVLASTVGNITSSNPFDYNTVGHEIGHYLGLAHPFQGSETDTCSLDGDFLFDTPPTFFTPGVGRFANISTRNFCSDPDSNTCTTDNPDLPDQYENFMDYFSGACSNNMFTLGQAARMQFTLNNYRRGLWQEENLLSTGIKYDTFDSKPIPVPAFNMANNQSLSETRVCVGNSVTFRDGSWNATITAWEWNFGEGATPATFTGQFPPAVTYSTPGDKTISLKVTGANGSNTLVAENYLHVEGPSESIQSVAYAPDWDYQNNYLDEGWFFENEVKTTTNPWTRVSGTQYDGVSSLRLNGRSLSRFFRYSLVSPSFDLTGASNPYFEFYYAFAPNLTSIPTNTGNTTGDSQDGLFVFVSTDCGRTWTQRFFVGGNPTATVQNKINPLSTLSVNPSTQTTGVQSSVDFRPSGPAQWKMIRIQGTTSVPAQNNVRFKVTFSAAGGNHLYIDNMKVGFVTNVSEISKSNLALNVYPNPFGESAKLTYELAMPTHVNIELYDIMGRKVSDVINENQVAGSQEVTINKANLNLSKGMYIIRITLGNESVYTEKLMVE
jgi:PKD repeat protein